MAILGKKSTKVSKTKIVKPVKNRRGLMKVLAKIGGYFKGSWTELKQVRWPDRKSTWSLTGAVILFTGIFIVLIVLLDAGFSELFKLIIK